MKENKGTYYGLFPASVSLVDFSDKVERVSDYVRYMFDRTSMIFNYNGLPDTISKRNLELMLQSNGCVLWHKVNGKLYVFNGGLGGKANEYYFPTEFLVSNPALNYSKNVKIDEEGILMANDSTYTGLLPLHNKYANLLVETDITIRDATINLRIQALISAKDDKTKASAIKYLEDVEKGKVGIIAESAFLDGLKSQPYQQQASNIVSQLIELKQYLQAGWYNEMGLNANYNMKRESINSNESQLNDDMLHPLIDNMLEQRKLALEKVNAIFGTNITVEFNSAWLENEIEHMIALRQKVEQKQEVKEGKNNEKDDTGNS